jgi:hypothetical protein
LENHEVKKEEFADGSKGTMLVEGDFAAAKQSLDRLREMRAQTDPTRAA